MNNIMTIYIKSIVYIREKKSTHQKAISLNAFLDRDKNKGKVSQNPWQPHNTIIENELDTVIESGLGLKTVATDIV